MLLTLACAGLLYAACVALFHAAPKRTQLGFVKTHPRGTLIARIAAVALIAAALFVLAHGIGWEYAIPVTLGAAGAAGVVSLLVATFAAPRHLVSGAALLALGSASALASIVGAA